MRRWWSKGLIGATLAASAVGACVGGMPEGGAIAGESRKGAPADAGLDAAHVADAGDGGCPHGRLEDPHRGFVRCLEPNEVDASWLPPAPQPEPPQRAQDAGEGDAGAGDAGPGADAGAADAAAPDAGAAPAPVTPGVPPLVEAKPPAFMSGDVPELEKKLPKILEGIAKCVADAGGLPGASGTLKVQFLVRARGRAEGVEVLTAKGLPDGAEACVRKLLKNRSVGAPSADPVGVTLTLTLKPPP